MEHGGVFLHLAVLTMLVRLLPSELLCWPDDVYTPPRGLGGGGPRPELLIPKEYVCACGWELPIVPGGAGCLSQEVEQEEEEAEGVVDTEWEMFWSPPPVPAPRP